MKLKSYFSATVEAAMELARQEMGDEALLINARPATPETRYLGAYEVVFGIPPQYAAPSKDVSKEDVSTENSGDLPAARLAAEPLVSLRLAAPESSLVNDVADLKRGLAQLMETLASVNNTAGSAPKPPALPVIAPQDALYAQLRAQDLDPALAQAVAEGTPLEDLFQVDATLGRPGIERAIVAFVGPPGAGKTSTLVKLAARFGLTARKPVQILSTDVFRIAAADQLRSLASILGIGFDVAETAGALAQLLEEHRSKDLIFIDTPGLTRTEMEDAADLAHFISTHPEIDTHLVLSASMRPADLARTIDRYAVFGPHKLLFTRIDETSQYGALVSESHRNSLPLSFLASGQQIPDDLEPADKARLSELILGLDGPDLHLDIPEIQPQKKGATA